MNGKQLVKKTQWKIIQNQQLMSVVQGLTFDVVDNIQQQIHNGTIQVNKERSQIDQLIKMDTLKNRSQSVPHLQSFISQHTQQDRQKTLEIIRKQKQYQERLEMSAKQIQEKAKLQQFMLKQKQEQQKIKLLSQKKQKVLESIEQIKKRQQIRRKKNQLENMNLSMAKSEKRLHERLIQRWKKQQQQTQMQKNQKYQKQKQLRKINFQQIKEHAIQHDQTMSKFRQSRVMNSRISQPEVKKFYQSVFMSRIIQQQQQTKQQTKNRKNMAKQFYQKKVEYGQLVRENFKPQIRQSSSAIQQSKVKISRSLSHLQTVHKGNQYMRDVNSKFSGHRSVIQSKIGQNKSQYFKYRNYLTELQIKKNEQEKQKQLNNKIEKKNKYQKQIKKIMNEQGLSQQQKFLKAKLATKKMEQSVSKKNPFKLIDSIHAKIQILRHVSG